jgi:hypothetical protein
MSMSIGMRLLLLSFLRSFVPLSAAWRDALSELQQK